MTWHLSAPCASADPEAWFPEPGVIPRDACRICSSCLYQPECRDEAITLGPSHGWWAGLSARQIHKIRIDLGLEVVEVGTDLDCANGHDRAANTRERTDGRKFCAACERDRSRLSSQRTRQRRKRAAA